MDEKIAMANYIRKQLTSRDLLEAIAEECAELQQAALKLIRAEKFTKNYTPVKVEDALANLLEEEQDVLLTMWILTGEERLNFCKDYWKLKRWAERLGYAGTCAGTGNSCTQCQQGACENRI